MDSIVFNSSKLEVNLRKHIYVLEYTSDFARDCIEFGLRYIKGMPSIVVLNNYNDYRDVIINGLDDSQNSIFILNNYELFKNNDIDNILRDNVNSCILIEVKDRVKLCNVYNNYGEAVIEDYSFRKIIIRDINM